MTAAILIESLQQRGFAVQADAERLTVFPSSALTDDDRQTIRDHKDELLALLRSETDAEVCPICHGALREQGGKYFRHVWCPQPGNHFAAWRTLDGGRLGDSGAPIFPVKSKGGEPVNNHGGVYLQAADQVGTERR